MRLLKLIPDHTEIDFVGVRYFAFAFDGLLLLAAIISIAMQGFNLGIDFTGGVLVEVQRCTVPGPWDVKHPCVGQTIDIHAMRATVEPLGFGEPILQYFGGGVCENPVNSCALIRVRPLAGVSDNAVAAKILTALGTEYNQRRVEVVGPKVSEELFRDGVIATILAVLMIAIYVAVRFEWQYGIGAIVATGHDVLVTAGMFSLFQLDFTLTSVAALLTLAGYSVNDTVVVFDRIRENRRRYKKMPLGELINLSTNQTLSRTVLTSICTAISIVPLLLFGGPTLFDFSAAIVFGIVVGTFSSIYVAAALLLYLPHPHVREERAATKTASGR
jgi:preprotein translocase subunit SecF